VQCRIVPANSLLIQIEIYAHFNLFKALTFVNNNSLRLAFVIQKIKPLFVLHEIITKCFETFVHKLNKHVVIEKILKNLIFWQCDKYLYA